MLGLSERVDVLTASVEIVRGVEVVDWSDPHIDEGVPASTYYTKTAGDFERGVQYDEEIRVIMRPRVFDPKKQRIRWRGTTYTVMEAPRTHYRNGIAHHVSVTLGVRV